MTVSKKLILPETIDRETRRRAAQLKQANLVIMRSEDGENWNPVLPEDVPAWVKDPDVIKELAEGNACQGVGESAWYGALHADDTGVRH